MNIIHLMQIAKWKMAKLALAMLRDGSSGGVIRTVVISKDGVEREMLGGDRLPRFAEL